MADLNPLFGIPPADSAIRAPAAIPGTQPQGLGGFMQGDAFGNMLTAAGISLMSSPRNAPLSNFGQALNNAQTATFRQQQADQEAAAREEEKLRRAELAEYALNIVHPSLRSLAQSQPEVALKLNEQMQPPTTQLTTDQQNWMFAQQNPGFAAAYGLTGAPPIPEDIADAQNRETLANQYGLEGTARQEFILTGKLPAARGAVPMTPTIQKELFETDEAILAGQSAIGSLERAKQLSAVAYDGPFAEQRGYGAAMFGDRAGQATIELKNEVTTQALSQLKAIFGAAPTEGERKILMDIQGSADQPRAVRDAIYQRAVEAANRRLAANQAKAAGLRDGSYFGTGYSASTGGAPIGGTGSPEGIDPADWEFMSPEERALWQ